MAAQKQRRWQVAGRWLLRQGGPRCLPKQVGRSRAEEQGGSGGKRSLSGKQSSSFWGRGSGRAGSRGSGVGEGRLGPGQVTEGEPSAEMGRRHREVSGPRKEWCHLHRGAGGPRACPTQTAS